MRLASNLSLLLLLLVVVACGPERIDTSTELEFQRSYERVRLSLPEDERQGFEDAIRRLGVDDLTHYSEDEDADAATRSILGRLDGKSAKEILEEARELDRR